MEKVTSSVLAFFSSVSLGLLSFIGMLILSGSWPWAIVAFFLASVIEGEIFDQNIKQAIQNLVTGPIVELELSIARRELEQDNKYQKYAAKLKATKCNETRARMKEKMQAMENAFVEKIIRSDLPARAYVMKRRAAIKSEIRRKVVAFVFCSILAVGAGVSSGLATVSAAYTGLMTLGIAAGTALGIAVPIAIISSVGYALMMYINVADMVQNDTLHQWAKNTRDFFVRRENESLTWMAARCFFAGIGAATVVGLSVFATIATAGTWWIAAKKGALLMAGMTETVAKVIRTVTVISMAIPNIIFNTVNALKSVGEIANYTVRNLSAKLGHHFLRPLENKNILQCMNPFYWLAKSAELVIHAVVFSGHLISVGLTSDGLAGVPPIITTGAGTLTELLTDWHYIFEMHDHEKDAAHDHDHDHDHEHGPDHDHEEHGHHHHSNLPSKFALILLFPLIVLARAWEWTFSVGKAPHHEHAHHEHAHHHHDNEHDEHAHDAPVKDQVVSPRPISHASSAASVISQLQNHDHHCHHHHHAEEKSGYETTVSHESTSSLDSSWSPRLHVSKSVSPAPKSAEEIDQEMTEGMQNLFAASMS